MNFELKRVPEWNASELASGPRAEPLGKLTGLPIKVDREKRVPTIPPEIVIDTISLRASEKLPYVLDQTLACKKKANVTRCSQAVTHPSTDRARCCLTSVIGREPLKTEEIWQFSTVTNRLHGWCGGRVNGCYAKYGGRKLPCDKATSTTTNFTFSMHHYLPA
uniref:SFRICE_031246 n=1 Tax=Spodoptera frugiperda TaxID=7108 RepID=A0A2H1W158_SPOFR